MINHLARWDLQKTSCASHWTHRQWARNVEQHMVTAQIDAGSSLCGVSCECGAEVTDKILTGENISARVFIHTQQASVVEVLWTDSLRWRIVFAQLGSVLFLIHSPIRCPCSFTLNTVTVNCQSVLSCAGGLPADKWPGGEVQGEPCQSQSALCCCSNLRRCEGGGQREAETEREREEMFTRYILKKFF